MVARKEVFVRLLTLRANSYGGASVEVVEGRTVISKGLYSIVRHPKYVAAVVMAAGAARTRVMVVACPR